LKEELDWPSPPADQLLLCKSSCLRRRKKKAAAAAAEEEEEEVVAEYAIHANLAGARTVFLEK
jgi:hypothetical protein